MLVCRMAKGVNYRGGGGDEREGALFSNVVIRETEM